MAPIVELFRIDPGGMIFNKCFVHQVPCWIWVPAHVRFPPAMEPWPLMAWGLMLTAIIKAVQSRDFTEKDIIFLHPSSKYFFLDSAKALKMKWIESMFFLGHLEDQKGQTSVVSHKFFKGWRGTARPSGSEC